MKTSKHVKGAHMGAPLQDSVGADPRVCPHHGSTLNPVGADLRVCPRHGAPRRLIILLILFMFGVIPCQGGNMPAVTVLTDQEIPVGGNFHLAADIYMPASASVSGSNPTFPVVLMMTPYGSPNEGDRARYFAENDYIYMVVNVRGKEKSEGLFMPNETEGRDGAAVCRWIVKQPWSNGKIGMIGGSYRGMAQWLTACQSPPGLMTIIPTAPAAPGIDYPLLNNIFWLYSVQWLALVEGKTWNLKLYSDTLYWKKQYLKAYRGEIPFYRMGQFTGASNEAFKKWMSHPDVDAYWERILPAEADYDKINIPVLSITGFFDEDHIGCLYYYTRYDRNRNARANNYLVMGPWDHAGTRAPVPNLGGLTFGEHAVLDMNQLQLEWFDWIMKGGKKPKFLKKRISYYVAGQNAWQYADALNEFERDMKRYYLASGPDRTSGRLTEKLSDDTGPDSFIYDPMDFSAAADYLKHDGPNYAFIRSFVKDCFTDSFNATDPKRLIYQTLPFEKNTVIGGCIKATLYLSLNVPDTDLRCDLYEIKPDGNVIYLTSDMMRARYRRTLTKQKLVKIGAVYPYEFDKFYFFAREIPAGSSLRFVFGPTDSPELEKNFNSGGVVAYETPADSQIARVTLFHNKKYPSYIEIPFLN
ncbi:MAG: CocE/NonD family hydrolase [Candidatus Omnitrophota bacterium]